MEAIIVKERTINGFWIEITKDNGQIEREHLRGARGGLSWPSSSSPGFYIILGQLSKTLPNGRRPLRFLKEGSHHIVSNLFQEMLNAMGEFQAYEIFSDVSFKYQNYILDFHHFYRTRKLQRIKLLPAPYFQSFGHRIYVTKKWVQDGALEIGEAATLREQLRTIKEDDLKQNAQELFGGVNALGYVVAAFDVSDYSPSARRTVPSEPPPWGAWT